MTYIIIGMLFTGVGIVFTLLGTLRQGKETQKFQDSIINSTHKNIELSERLSENSTTSQRELTELSNKNAELTLKLIELSEDRFRRLTKPEINVFRIEENLNLRTNSFFLVRAKNTGNNDCTDARLIIDRHNSPLGRSFMIQSFRKLPKDTQVEYKIPLFQSDIFLQIARSEEKEEFENIFLKRYLNNEIAVVIHFHFEYQWNGETLKSSQFSIVKTNNQKVYGSSSEEYVESNQN